MEGAQFVDQFKSLSGKGLSFEGVLARVHETITEEEFEKGGTLTEQGLQSLKSYLSEVPADAFKANMKVNEIPMLFTVETFCKLVISAVGQQQTTSVA